VKQLFWICVLACTSFTFWSVGKFRFFQTVDFISKSSNAITDNGLQLDEVAEIEAQLFNFTQKFNRKTVVEFSTKPAILQNLC